MIHHVAERKVGLEVAKAQRAADTEMAERIEIGAGAVNR
jgi:hypothetical protein